MYVFKEIKANKIASMMFIISLFISSICISIGLNMILNEANYVKEYNNFAKKNNLIDLSFNEKVEFTEFAKLAETIAKDEYQVSLPKVRFTIENKFGFVVGIINRFEQFKIIEGRNFTGEELRGTEKKIIIGNNYVDKSYTKEGKRYIDILNESFEVIGVVGEKYGGESFYDFDVYIPYKALPKEILAKKIDIAQITTNSKVIIDNDFIIKNNISNYDIKNIKMKNLITEITTKYQDFLRFILIVFVFVIINTSLLTMSWINKIRYKVSIKIVLGYSLKRIIKELLIELSILALIANLLSAIVYKLFSKFIEDLFFIRIGMSPTNFILGLIISLIICVTISLIQLKFISIANFSSIMQE